MRPSARNTSRGSTGRYSFANRKTQHQENFRDTNRTLGRWANRGCYKQPVNKRPVYAACTHECASGAFGASGATQIKDLACYQYVGKFNSVPGHHISKNLAESRLALPVLSQSGIFRRDPVRFLITMMAKDLNSNCLSLSPLSVRFCLRRG
jgi:hypothetical protein